MHDLPFLRLLLLPVLLVSGTYPGRSSAQTCGNGFVEPGEDCDNGGICIGGSNAGAVCASESDCLGEGVCDAFGLPGGGQRKVCDGDADCGGARCIYCKPFGGDGCAANCTSEAEVQFTLVPGELLETPQPTRDPLVAGTSGGVIHGDILTIPLPFSGTQKFIIGRERNGRIPFTQKPQGTVLPRIPVNTLACACVRGVVLRTCGGTEKEADGVTDSIDCTSGASVCTGGKPCVAVAGPGNSGEGSIGCTGLPAVNYSVLQDAGGSTGLPGPPVLTLDRVGGPGSALAVTASTIGTIIGPCAVPGPDYGPDGEFCTEDDPLHSRGTASLQTLTTGNASARVLSANDINGNHVGPFGFSGASLACAELVNGSFAGGALASAFTTLDMATVGDIVVTSLFVGQPEPSPTIAQSRTPTHTATSSPTSTSTQTPTITPTATDTPSATPSDTPTATPTESPTSIPTDTPTSTPTPTETPTQTQTPRIVHIEVGSGRGRPGDAVEVTVSLASSGLSVAATGNDLSVDRQALTLDPAACRVNPLIRKSLIASVLREDAATRTLRFFVQPDQNADPIPDGPLYTCTLRISPSALPAVYALQNGTAIAVSVTGAMLEPVVGANGTLAVSLVLPTPTPARCVGDCNRDGSVTINELLIMVNVALGSASPSACESGDVDGDGAITVTEIIAAVNRVLAGCPSS